MRYWISLIVGMFCWLPVQAICTVSEDSVCLYGQAPDYAGKTLRIQGYTYFGDGWCGEYPLLKETTVQADGSFSVRFPVTHTQKIFLPLGRFQGSLFVEGGHSYNINLPPYTPLKKQDELNPYFEPEEVLLSLNHLPEHDLNLLISSFEDSFDQAWAHLQQIGATPHAISEELKRVEGDYPSYGNVFFDEYRTYRYALLVNLYEKEAPNRAIYTFFLDQPVLYHQPSYWEAFEVLFTNFSSISSLQNNLPLMEAVILQKVAQGDLGLEYLDNLQVTESRQLAAGIRREKEKRQIGTRLDWEKIVNIQGDTLVWDELQFNQAYLIFANSYLNESQSDLLYAEQMQALYKDRCLFVLIFDKESLSTTQKTCQNSSLKTFTFSTANNPQIRAIFDNVNLPSYFLVGPDKRLRLSPAPQPKDFAP